MFGRKKNDPVKVTRETLDEISCKTEGATGEKTLTFVLRDGRRIELDQAALEAEAVALMRHVQLRAQGATGVVAEDVDDLAAALRAGYEEHCKVCPSCRAKAAARPQA